MKKLAAGALTVALALGVTTAPFSPLANEDAQADETAPVTSTLKMATPGLPLAAANLDNERQAQDSEDGKHTMTFYYLEMVLYDDPEFSHPSNLRLLYTRTVEGLNVGDQLDTWDYVDDIDGYCFFDAYPAKPVVGEDNHLNGVEVWYGNLEVHNYTVNTYHVSDGTNENVDIVDPNAVVEDINGQPVRFQKIDSEVVTEQYFNKKIVGDDVAAPIEHMEYLGSYPESIRIKTDHEQNVINLLYIDNSTTLPDAVEVPAETFGTVSGESAPVPSMPGTDSGSSANGPSSDAGTDETESADTDSPASNAPSSEEDEASQEEAGTAGDATQVAMSASSAGHRTEVVRPLPQTGDGMGGIATLAGTTSVAAALMLVAAGTALRRVR